MATWLADAVAAYDGPIRPGRITPIRAGSPIDTLVAALATRRAGGIPLVGDGRWTQEYWAELRKHIEQGSEQPGIGWATSSSGSTGMPRMILRSAESWSDSFDALTALLELTSGDVVHLPAPISASMSLFSAAHANAVGASISLPGGHGFAADALDGATVVHGTPYALRAIVESGVPNRLRVALVGGARLDSDLRASAEAQGIRVVAYYGAAELSFVAVDTDGTGLRPFPGVELEDRGELWVRSPYLAAGYLGSARGSLRRDALGWATVGDLVMCTPLGTLTLQGRSDGAILTAAATVIPEDVEAGLRAIDGVGDAVVFGIANAGAGFLVAAVVETTAGAPATLHELREQARMRLAPSHLPRQWFRADALVRTASGKPARAQIAQDALAGQIARYA